MEWLIAIFPLIGDGTAKIFLNANGKMDDVSNELRAFLDYVAGRHPEDAFVNELEAAVNEAKRNREWRHEYSLSEAAIAGSDKRRACASSI